MLAIRAILGMDSPAIKKKVPAARILAVVSRIDEQRAKAPVAFVFDIVLTTASSPNEFLNFSVSRDYNIYQRFVKQYLGKILIIFWVDTNNFSYCLCNKDL